MKMRMILTIAGVVLFAATFTTWAQEEAAPEPEAEAEAPAPAAAGPAATLVEFKGSVEVRSSEDSPWQAAEADMELGPNWWISTGLRGQAVLRFGESSDVVVQRLTEMKISEFSQSTEEVKTRLEMKYGAVRVQVKRVTAANDFAVSCPTATASVTGTKIKEMSYYRGVGAKLRMGDEGHAKFSVNPTRPVGPNETTDDKLTSPIVYAKLTTWLPVTFNGFTRDEVRSNIWRGTLGPGSWEKLTPNSPSNTHIYHRLGGTCTNGHTNGGPVVPEPEEPVEPW
jgi:hypothetical protein